jgi:alkylhydroperoxidase family enzyme
VIDRVSARCGCEYEWGVHMAFYGEKAGITAAQAYSLVHGDCTDACWADEDRTTLTFVDELHDHGRVSDATWAAMRVRFSDATLIELLVLAGWYHAIAYLASSARVELESFAHRFPARQS